MFERCIIPMTLNYINLTFFSIMLHDVLALKPQKMFNLFSAQGCISCTEEFNDDKLLTTFDVIATKIQT